MPSKTAEQTILTAKPNKQSMRSCSLKEGGVTVNTPKNKLKIPFNRTIDSDSHCVHS